MLLTSASDLNAVSGTMGRQSADRLAMKWTALFVLALALVGCHTAAEYRYWWLERANRRAAGYVGGVPESREEMVDRLYCSCLEAVDTSDSERCE